MPILLGALAAVFEAKRAYKVALASGSATTIIQYITKQTGLASVFDAIVYGDTIWRSKPAPDIYLEAARQLDRLPAQAVGIEDSANGIRAVKAAGMRAIAVPVAAFPLSTDALQLADLVLLSLESFSVDLVQSL